jgi:Copper transport outer membrane protein, MctB
MGYSGRYHAASLVAVFIALAIGILIGIGLADDVVSSASEELETSLRSDLRDAQGRADDLQADLDRSDRFSEQVLSPLLENRLAGQRVALIEFGDVPDELATDAREAVEKAGGDLSSVAAIARPPDLDALIDALPQRFARIKRDPDQLAALGKTLGTDIARDGTITEELKPALFDSFTGSLQGADRVILARADTADLDPAVREVSATFEDAIIAGIQGRALATVGAELTTTDPSTLGPFIDAGLPTVDHLDIPAGEVSLVYALDGFGGNYGVKDESRSFLPDFQHSSPAAGAP